MFSLFLFPQRTPISHKVIEKRRRDRINRCLNELGKTVPMALAKQVLLKLKCIFCVIDIALIIQYLKCRNTMSMNQSSPKNTVMYPQPNSF